MWQIILIILAVLYILNPYDILPDLLVGWGWLDDLVIIGFLLRYFMKRRMSWPPFQHKRDNRQDDRSSEANNSGNSRSGARNQQQRASSAERDPYQILGIARGAPQETIKQAYRELAGKYHPDKVEYLGEEFKVLAEKRFKEIQRAYDELKGN